MSLEALGWTPSLESQFSEFRTRGFVPARVIVEHRERYIISSDFGDKSAEVTGKLRFGATSRLDFPTVGDWVAVSGSATDELFVIHAFLPRRTLFVRKVAGQNTEPQPLAANIDSVFLVTDGGLDFSPRRMERYLTLAYESGATPVILLNKADISADMDERIVEMESSAPGVPVLAISAATGEHFDQLAPYIESGKTITLIGSSGVGKSTIVNRLLGEERIKTNEVRESDGRGRHTTTSRQLIALPTGGLLIDTPGMREIQLWADEDSLAGTFEDIDQLVSNCRFSDCTHASEPGCAVRAALENGTLAEDRYASFLKLKRELRYLETRQDIKAALAEKARWKKIHRIGMEHMRIKYGGGRRGR
jgi:ribosome biogenesis GTPase